jgi:glycerol uptake facilitator-like aquaporin
VTVERARALGAEALGTFALVLFGCGAIMVDAEEGGLGNVGVSLAFGLIVMAMVLAFAHVSGAHINPAVTLALASRRRFAWSTVPGYMGAQITGAIAAASCALRLATQQASVRPRLRDRLRSPLGGRCL